MFRLFFASLLIAASLAGQDGWQAARWGMTEQELLDAFPGQAVRLDGPTAPRDFDGIVARIGIPSVTIAGVQFAVYFLPGAAGLDQVKLMLRDRALASPELFTRVESALAEKYGRPSFHRGAGNLTLSRWAHAHTTITLTRSEVPAVRFQSLYLTYARKTPPTDPL